MAKKKHWKAQIRAEVAAALQSNPKTAWEQKPADTPKPQGISAASLVTRDRSPVPISSLSMRDLPLIRRDLARVAIVTVGLVVFLAGVTVTDQRTNFLNILYEKVSRSIERLGASQSPSPTTSDTSPPADSPTESPQSAPAAGD